MCRTSLPGRRGQAQIQNLPAGGVVLYVISSLLGRATAPGSSGLVFLPHLQGRWEAVLVPPPAMAASLSQRSRGHA